MPRTSNWFTAVRNQGRREARNHRIPVCSRHGHMRYDEEAEGSSSSTTEDERRELERRRDRRRNLRDRLRDEEENIGPDGRKIRSTKSRICAWLNCFCGILIVIGLIFVFYVITTLIIDGSSPLDFISFSNNNSSSKENTTTVNKLVPNGERNGTDVPSENKSDITKTTIKFKISSTTPPTKRESKEVIENQLKMDDPYFETDSDSRFRPGLEAEETQREVKYIQGTNGRSYIAFVPVPLDNNKDSKNGDYVDKKKEEISLISVNRNGKSPHLYRYDDQGKSKDLSNHNHRVIRPINQNTYNNRRSQDSLNLDSKIISHYVPPPNDRKTIQRIVKSSNRNYYLDSSPRPYDSNLRRTGSIINQGQAVRYHEQDHRPNKAFNSPRRPTTRDRFGDISAHSVGVSVHSRPYPIPRPPNRHRTHNQQRDRPINNKSYNSDRMPDRRQRPSIPDSSKRPPNDFRYPPNAGNIQDIIHFMNKGERPVNTKHYEPQYENRQIDNNFDKITNPTEYYDDQLIINNYDDNQDRTIFYIKDDGSPIESFSSDESVDRSRYDVNTHHHEYIEDHKIKHEMPYDKGSLPPVRNTYKVYGSHENTSREKKPLRLMLDIYPSDDHSSKSSSNLYSSVSVEGDYRRYDNNERHQTENGHKKEIILHLNLFTQHPTHRSEPDLRENAVSMKIPVNGKLSPLDIYKAFVAQARKSPVASPRRGHLLGTSLQPESKIKADEISLEDGRRLLEAIEDGLRELDSYLPIENKFLFSNHPIPEEDIISAGTNSEGDVSLFQNHRTHR